MNAFKASRTVKSYIQKLNAPPNEIFPLLCPTMEYEWIEPWNCEMIFSESGYAEDNCIFRTEFPGDIEPETWIVSQYDINKTIQFIRFNSSIVIRYNVVLKDNRDGTTDAIFEQIVTGLNKNGNKYVEGFTDEDYFSEMSTLEKMLNYYLNNGEMLKMTE